MKTIGLNRSFLVSIFLHLFIVLLLSLTLPKNPFLNQQEPIVVNINTPTETMASGLEKVLDKPVSQDAPALTKRVVKPPEKSPITEKIKPSREMIKPTDNREAIKRDLQASAKTQNTEKIRQTIQKSNLPKEKPKQSEYESADKALDDFFEKEEKSPAQNQKEVEDLSDTIDNILDNTGKTESKANVGGKPGFADPLNDAKWSSKPRKTLFFPDIQSKIPVEYRKKGMGYSVKVEIAFDMNGLAVRVDLLESSGDPVIDNLFLTELRKIRVESSPKAGIDEISKSFTISVK